jgi:antitoxin component YwqK of YwqJK toxin-antitoxin module
MARMTILRVNYDELDGDEWGTDIWYLNGEPFTGIAYELYKNGQLWGDGEYMNGQLSGAYHEWYLSGQLKFEGYVVKLSERAKLGEGEPASWEHEWFENGQLKHERFSNKRGYCITEKKWNEQGELIYEYERPSPDKQS